MVVMSRGGAKTFWNVDLPKDIIYLWHDGYQSFGFTIEWKKFTRNDLIERKVQKQNDNISKKRTPEIQYAPAYVWVFYNNTDFFGGWYTYILSYKKDWAVNFRGFNKQIALQAMNMFPCGILPIVENFNQWMVEFAKTYPHKGFRRKGPQGIRKCIVGHDKWQPKILLGTDAKALVSG